MQKWVKELKKMLGEDICLCIVGKKDTTIGRVNASDIKKHASQVIKQIWKRTEQLK